MGTEMRQGEQWNLELREVHVEAPEPRQTCMIRHNGTTEGPSAGTISGTRAQARSWRAGGAPSNARDLEPLELPQYATQDSNLRPSAPEAEALGLSHTSAKHVTGSTSPRSASASA